ncbi:MAG: efflux RND transporter periplasmic adaptor subunit [Saprospiraceae bacterium]|nr:efflux RND transporter periplasmic adaptor subunit [Saprospiraceae bacterium]
MKSLTLSLALIIAIVSCKPNESNNNSAEGKRALLESKKQELKNIQDEIASLTEELAALDPTTTKPTITVTTEEIKVSVFNRYIDLQGIVSTDDLVNAGSELGGRITRLSVKEGQNVRKGQLIATIDAESIERQKDEISKSLDLAMEVYDRQKRLWEQNIGSEVQFLQAKNNKERLEKSLQTIDSQLKKRNVYAPLNGVVDNVFLKEGEMTAPGSPIVQILNISKVKVTADVPESYLGKVKTGDKVVVTFPALGKEMTKTVTQTGRTIDPANRTFGVEINLDNSSGELKPNLLSVVKINDLTVKDAITIPVDVVQQEVNGNRYVFIAKEENGILMAHKANITIGESADGKILVLTGLKSGDQLIIKGARNVTEKSPVIINKE